MWRTDFVGLAEQGTLPAKDWIPLSQSVETVELHVWLAGKLLASALVNLVPQLSDGVDQLAVASLYRETTVACKFERSTF